MKSDLAALAAALLAVDPGGLGGARLRPGRSPFAEAWLDGLRALLPPGTAFRRLPAHADDTAVLGGLDLGATLARGSAVLHRGLLAASDGGCVVVPMAERLSAARGALLARVLDQAAVTIEREGVAARHAAGIAIIALDESDPDEGDDAAARPSEAVPACLADRLGLVLDLRPAQEPAPREARRPADGHSLAPPSPDTDGQLAARLAQARQTLRDVADDPARQRALAEAAMQLGIESPRALWQAWRACRAAAAWGGRTHLEDEDLQVAVALVLLPRATQWPAAAASSADGPDADPPPADAGPPPGEADGQPAPPPADGAFDTPGPGPRASDNADDTPPADAVDPAPERLIAAAAAALPPGLLLSLAAARARRTPGKSGRAGATSRGGAAGRPCGSRPGAPRGATRLHLIDTLRAAAPWQALRRRTPPHEPRRRAIIVTADDFRIRRYTQRRETTTVFVVDASGSAALHRLAEAKGAVERLLAECYVRRDRVALVAFRVTPSGPGAQLLLPPTRSLARARRCLAALAGGGGTPLASGLALAHAVVETERRRGASLVTVVLSDGRANVALDGSPGRATAMADALSTARRWAAEDQRALWLDTSPLPHDAARQLAQAMAARYLHLPVADSSALVRALASGTG